jgi:AAA15 family ATPase/GTPase
MVGAWAFPRSEAEPPRPHSWIHSRERDVKIRQVSIKTVTSYKEETTFAFDDKLNILIGPNGGGKSNLQKILAVILSNYFIHQYDFHSDENNRKIQQVDLWSRYALQSNLDKFFDDNSE